MSKDIEVRPPLIVDPDKDFLKSIVAAQNKDNLPTLTTHVGKEAQLIIADRTQEISAVFINPKVTNPSGISVIRATHQHRPVVPVYLIYDGESPYSDKELRHLGIQKAIQKPISLEDIFKLITIKKINFDADAAIASGQKNTDVINTEVSSDDKDFSAIRAEDFVAGSICFFDVYVRLNSSKYIKILQSGDHFSRAQIESYLKKKVTHFYIRKEMQAHYVNYCDRLATAAVNATNVSLDFKISQSLNHGEEVLNFLQDGGLNEENIKYAAQFVNNLQTLTKQLEVEKQTPIKDFLDDVTAYDHGVGVSMIASLLVRPLKITSNDPIETVGMASLFHDLGLRKLGLEPHEDEAKMTDQQKELFYTHPRVSAEMLTKVKGIKPVVIQAVSQHHERRNKKGFPDKIGAGSISLVAEIIGISDEYFRLLHKLKEGTQMNLQFYLEHKIYYAFSNNLVAEFKKLFDIKDLAKLQAQHLKK